MNLTMALCMRCYEADTPHDIEYCAACQDEILQREIEWLLAGESRIMLILNRIFFAYNTNRILFVTKWLSIAAVIALAAYSIYVKAN